MKGLCNICINNISRFLGPRGLHYTIPLGPSGLHRPPGPPRPPRTHKPPEPSGLNRFAGHSELSEPKGGLISEGILTLVPSPIKSAKSLL